MVSESLKLTFNLLTTFLNIESHIKDQIFYLAFCLVMARFDKSNKIAFITNTLNHVM